MKESGAPLGGEMSGHMFFGPPDYLGFDDALYGAARLLRIVAEAREPVSRFLADLPAMVSTPEIRVDCPEDRKVPVVAAAARHFAAQYPTVTIDGVRWRAAGGWGLIRASNTQPILVCRFEARDARSLDAIRREAMQVLEAQGVRLPAT
jgi:phosphomannomutase/phosphoglucomutase